MSSDDFSLVGLVIHGMEKLPSYVGKIIKTYKDPY